jgi:sigma-54-specific transcriptional regulator
VFEDPKSRELLARIERIAPSDATILVIGETGTGKEIVARHIHRLSRRASRPFLAVNCGAFSESLIESELFGHEKGAFTGAVAEKAGWFESAAGGTLFLDEIGDLPLPLQVKLLRVLQEREVVRLGSHRAVPVDVRLIAATNVRLEDALAAGRFRADLFYRLAVAKVAIDALRDRPGDVLPLARHFVEVYGNPPAGTEDPSAPVLTADAERALLSHRWPGNIRELENAVHHAVLVCRDRRITATDLALASPASFHGRAAIDAPLERPRPSETLTSGGGAPAVAVDVCPGSQGAGVPPSDPRATLRDALRSLYDEGAPQLWDELEETIMRSAYAHAGNNQLKTARLLGVSRSVVRARLLEFGVLARAERDGEPEEPLGPPDGGPSRRAGPPSHVLVIEDDGAVRASLAELLEDSGYQVSLAENGQVALQLLHSARIPDLIVLDLMMPVMDGWAFRAIQKDDPKLSLIPVVAISADRTRSATAISAHAYLRKPLDAGEFLRTVERTHRLSARPTSNNDAA